LNRNLGAYPGEGTLELLDPGTLDQTLAVPGFGSITLYRLTTNGG
jgi:hypothetical protein